MAQLNFSNISTIADKLIGVPYKHLGRKLRVGVDCFGLVIMFYRLFGVQLKGYPSAYKEDWYKDGNLIEEHWDENFQTVKDPLPGDVVCMKIRNSKVTNHLAVVLPDGYLLNTDRVVGVHRIRLILVKDLVVCFKRYISLL